MAATEEVDLVKQATELEAKTLQAAWRLKVIEMHATPDAHKPFKMPDPPDLYNLKGKDGKLVSKFAQSVQDLGTTPTSTVDLREAVNLLNSHFEAEFENLMQGKKSSSKEADEKRFADIKSHTEDAYKAVGDITTDPLKKECENKVAELKKVMDDKKNNEDYIAELQRCNEEMQRIVMQHNYVRLEQGLEGLKAADATITNIVDAGAVIKAGTPLPDSAVLDVNGGTKVAVSKGIIKPANVKDATSVKAWQDVFSVLATQGDTLVLTLPTDPTMSSSKDVFKAMFAAAQTSGRKIEFEHGDDYFFKMLGEQDFKEFKKDLNSHNTGLETAQNKALGEAEKEIANVAGLSSDSQVAITELNQHYNALQDIDTGLGKMGALPLTAQVQELTDAVTALTSQAEKLDEKDRGELKQADFGYEIQAEKIQNLANQIEATAGKLNADIATRYKGVNIPPEVQKSLNQIKDAIKNKDEALETTKDAAVKYYSKGPGLTP